MANPNGTPANLKPAWKPGESGNPNGRPCVSAELKQIRDEFGDWPRKELMRLSMDKRIKPETRARILMYLDEQFNGKAKQAVEQTIREKVPTLEELYAVDGPIGQARKALAERESKAE